MGGGKGRPQPTDQTVVQTNLPKYVKPYLERLLDRTEGESLRDYEAYTGSRFQEAGADVTDAQQQIRNIAGTGIAGMPQAQAATLAGVGRALQGMGYEAEAFGPDAISSRMSPYMQQVVDVQKERAILDAQRAAAAEPRSKRDWLRRLSAGNSQKYRLRGNSRLMSRQHPSLTGIDQPESPQKD